MITEAIIKRIEASPLLDRTGRMLGNAIARVVRPGRLKSWLSGTPIRHPLHPLLTDVTIGAWSSAALLDLVDAQRGADILVAAGALSALPTAVTGWSDLSDITDAPSRSVAVAHAAGNATALALFTASLAARRSGARRAGVALSTAGMAALTSAGFLGGHLAYRQGIGVDETIFEPSLPSWTPVMKDEDLPPNDARRVNVEGVNVMLYRDDETVHALANRCTHRGGPLHKGTVADGCVTCPWHLSTFRLSDGDVVRGPATAPQPRYEVRIEDGQIEIRSPD